MEKLNKLLAEKGDETIGYCYSISPEESSEGELEKDLKVCIEKAIQFIKGDTETQFPLSDFGAYISLVREVKCNELPRVADWVLEHMDENQDVVGLEEPLFQCTGEDTQVLDEMIFETIEKWVKERNVKFNN